MDTRTEGVGSSFQREKLSEEGKMKAKTAWKLIFCGDEVKEKIAFAILNETW